MGVTPVRPALGCVGSQTEVFARSKRPGFAILGAGRRVAPARRIARSSSSIVLYTSSPLAGVSALAVPAGGSLPPPAHHTRAHLLGAPAAPLPWGMGHTRATSTTGTTVAIPARGASVCSHAYIRGPHTRQPDGARSPPDVCCESALGLAASWVKSGPGWRDPPQCRV
jgi:hypothetical protein